MKFMRRLYASGDHLELGESAEAILTRNKIISSYGS